MNYLSIEEFGAHLLSTGDLDPIYLALNNCQFEEAVKNRWLTAYCAFYNAGFACWASERTGREFWSCLMVAAVNQELTPYGQRWPRASERRHFRGIQAVQAITAWGATYQNAPEEMMKYISEGAPAFDLVLQRAKSHRSVGTWMGFKLVDLVDACMGKEINQTEIMLFLYETPRESLLRLWREKQGLSQNIKPKDEPLILKLMIEYLQQVFVDYTIPHKPGKPVDLFCLETIACKHLSHLHGHYPLFKDTKEITHSLRDWISYSSNAALFLKHMPKVFG